MREAPAPFGPIYPDLGVKVAKLRHGDDRKAHGEAVLEAIRAKNRTLHRRSVPATAINDSANILEARRRQQRSALLAYPSQVRRQRPPEEWKALYAKAMKQKAGGS